MSQPTRRELIAASAGAALLAGGALRAADPPAKGGLPHAKPEDIGLAPKHLQVA